MVFNVCTDTMDTSTPMKIYKYIVTTKQKYGVFHDGAIPEISDEVASDIYQIIQLLKQHDVYPHCIASEIMAYPDISKRILIEFLMTYLLNYRGYNPVCQLGRTYFLTEDYHDVYLLCDFFWTHVTFKNIPRNYIRYPITEYPTTRMKQRYNKIMHALWEESLSADPDDAWTDIDSVDVVVKKKKGLVQYIAWMEMNDFVQEICRHYDNFLITDKTTYVLIQVLDASRKSYHIAHRDIFQLHRWYMTMSKNKTWSQLHYISGDDDKIALSILQCMEGKITCVTQDNVFIWNQK